MKNSTNGKKNPTLIVLAVYMTIVAIGILAALVNAWRSGKILP